MKKTFAFTCGDVNGIGPEIVVKTLNKVFSKKKHSLIFFCPHNIFANTIKLINPTFKYKLVSQFKKEYNNSDKVIIVDMGKVEQKYSKIISAAGRTSYKSIISACLLSKKNLVDAIITAPISKEAFVKAKINFPGHTELLADYFNTKQFTMMFVSKKMKAALTTIHIPIKQVSKKITYAQLQNTFNVILQSLILDFNISKPNIAILGLNPHAGENGNIGVEEKNIISKFVKHNKKYVKGPFVPDAYFGNRLYKNYDCTIGMYHDQILIPFKLLNFNIGVNYTAGLSTVRTSPDHGTAFDIAGKGIAKPDSMIEAFYYAEKIVASREKNR